MTSETTSSTLSGSPALSLWLHELPSPLAVPLVRLKPRVDGGEWAGAFSAGLDAMTAALRWACYLGLADVFQKLHDDHPFARRDRLVPLFPRVRRVLEAGQRPEHLLACVGALFEAYRDHRELFIAPGLIEALEGSSGRLVASPDTLLRLYELGRSSGGALSGAEAEAAWRELDGLLGEAYAKLASCAALRLVQLNSLFEPGEGGKLRSGRHLLLRGYRMEEEDLSRGAIEIASGLRPRMRQLYVLDEAGERAVCLHPFVLFSASPDGAGGGAFFFNELRAGALSFSSPAGMPDLELRAESATDDEGSLDRIAGPIYQYFTELRALTSAHDAQALTAMPGFGRRSPVLSFQRTIDFHAEAFSGRTEYFERIDHAIAGPFRCVWITGFAGYGKSALMARLAQQHPGSIVYFISPERGAADASRFLAHVCQSIIDRFSLPDVIADDQLGNVSALRTLFAELLAKASEQVGSGKLVVLIDGLDESTRYCSRPEESIETVLPQSRDEIPERVVLVITSRPEEVNLSHLCDLKLDLAPFSREQIAAILGKQGWSAEAADVAYRKSDGQPIYFRFLLDGVKRGEIRPEGASSLPDGITAFYERFWRRCDEAQPAGPDAPSGRLLQHLLGLLSAAAEPLTQPDLVELVSGLDPLVKESDVRRAFAKEHLGRFVIGSRRYSLFHDTLREFVARTTRVNDGAPYGEARRYHETLARWCRQTAQADYGDTYLVYHLLHARQFHDAVALMEDGSPRGPVRRRMGERYGAAKLVRDLRYATEAARELNNLERIFCFTLLQISMQKLKKTAAMPEATAVLSGLGLAEDLGQLVDAVDKDDEKWTRASTVFAAEVGRGDGRAAEAWLPHLKKIWLNAPSYRKASLLEELLKRLERPTEPQVRRVLEAFGDMDRTQLPRALCNGLRAAPSLAAKLLLEQDVRKASSWYASNELCELAFELVAAGDEALGFKIFSLVGFSDLERALPYVRALLERDPAASLEALGKLQMQASEWSYIAKATALLRMVEAVAPDRAGAFLDKQQPDVKALGLCLRAASSPQAYEEASGFFVADCGLLSAIDVLACLSLLALAHRKHEPEAPSAWEGALAELISQIESATSTVEVDKQQIEQELRTLLPKAVAYMREIAHLFPDGKGALWVAVAAAAGAGERLLDERLLAWVKERAAASASGPAAELSAKVVAGVSPKMAQRLDYLRGRSAQHALLLPIMFSLSSIDAFADRLRAMVPLAQVSESDLTAIAPELCVDHEAMSKLLPCLVSEGGYAAGDSAASGALAQIGYADPLRAYSLWKQCRSIDHQAVVDAGKRLAAGGEAGGGEGLWSDRSVDAQALAETLLLGGRAEEGFDLVKQGKGGQSGWRVFSRHARAYFPTFLKELPSFMDGNAYASDEVLACVAEVLDSLSTEAEREDWVWQLLSSDSLQETVKLSLGRYAFRRGLSKTGVEYLRKLAESDADTLKRELPSLVLPWIECRLKDAPQVAGKMWEQLTGYLASRSLEFLGEIQSSFDTKISKLLSTQEVPAKLIEELSRSLGAGFEQSRAQVATALIKAGWGREVCEPWVKLEELYPTQQLFQGLGATPAPSWLRGMCLSAVERMVGGMNISSADVYYAMNLMIWPGWSSEERVRVEASVKARLEGPDPEDADDDIKKFLTDWRLLLKGVLSGDFTAVGVAAAESGSELPAKIGYMAELNPRLAWQILRAVPAPSVRAERATAVFNCGLLLDTRWAVETFGPTLTEDNALSMAQAALNKVGQTQWAAIEPFMRQAIDRLPPRSLATYEASGLLTGAAEPDAILTAVLAKLKEPLGFIDYFCQGQSQGFTGKAAPTEARFLAAARTELGRWTELIKHLADEPGVESWSITSKLTPLLKYLAQIGDAQEKKPIVEAVCGAVAAIVDARKGDRQNLLDELLKVIVRLDPDRALAWAARYEYKGYYLKEVLATVVEATPSRLDDIYRDLLRGMDEWTRRSHVVACAAKAPLELALAWQEREKLDPEELALACAKGRALDAEGMATLDPMVGPDPDKRFMLRLSALEVAGGVKSEAHKAWRDTAFAAYAKGGFVVDQYDQCVFRYPDDARLFVSAEPHLFAVLFALLPDKMDDSFTLAVRQAKPEIQPKLQNKLDEIRADAVPLLFKMSPSWILARRRDWSARSWWPYLGDDLFAIIEAMPPEDALKALSVFTYVEQRHLEAVLDGVSSQEEMRECLEALITEVLLANPDRLDMVMNVVMTYLPKAGFDTLASLAAWASQFVKAKALIGLEATDVGQLLALLRRIAEQRDGQGEGQGEGQARSLSEDEQRELAELEVTIRQLRRNGQDATLFENLRKRVLGEA